METITINLFYPLLFLTIIVVFFGICGVIKSRNGNMTFKDMFCKSSDNAKEVTLDTTSKMATMHNNALPTNFTVGHERELHTFECRLKVLEAKSEELNAKVDELMYKFAQISDK